jgi:carbamoyltransferase
MDLSYFDYCQGRAMTSEKFHRLFGGPPRDPEALITQRDMDLAASVQAVCEEVMLKCARHLHRLTRARNLVMAGGVALNCVGNGRILRDGPFENLWIQPAAGDAGGALGVAALVWHHVLGYPRRVEAADAQHGSLLGPEFSDEEAAVVLDASGARYRRFEHEADLLEQVCDLMIGGKIVGWAHGRMEFGPRALGARSIIGDARSPHMQATMNMKIKYRESFRPFAPCVLKDDAAEYFGLRGESPYMLLVAPVLEKHRSALSETERAALADPDLRRRVSVPRSSIPAVTHVDYSARVQTVDEARHGRFYRLMRRFKDKTGCSVIVNTSFNVRGEPMVCTPQDAYRCFMGTEIDALVLGNLLLLKEEQTAGRGGAEAYRASFAPD